MPSLEFSKSHIIRFQGMKKACFQRHAVGCDDFFLHIRSGFLHAVLPRIYVYIASRFYPCERILSHIPRTNKNRTDK